MKFLSLALILLLSGTQASEEFDTLNEVKLKTPVSGEQILQYNAHDGSYLNNTVRYQNTCEHQSRCMLIYVNEKARRCGSSTCDFIACFNSQVGHTPVNHWWKLYKQGYSYDDAAKWASTSCLQHEELGVDYACNTNEPNPDEDTGGCINKPNSKGKGVWDEYTINPETYVGEGLTFPEQPRRFMDYCLTIAPGHTGHMLMHSHYSLDWNGKNPQPVGKCTGTTEKVIQFESDKFGSAFCAPSSIEKKTYWPATDGSPGGTCSDKPEGEECVFSYTAPNYCWFEEFYPVCHITQATVDTLTNLCPNNDFPVVEYFEHANNPNDPPARIPLHNITHNPDGTVSFQIYSPFPEYEDPIDNDGVSNCQNCAMMNGKGAREDFHDFYVVYDQANEIGNEVCERQLALGKCAIDKVYTAKCRSDGVSVVTIFASGKDATSAAAAQIKNGVGTEVFECCPANYDPNFQADSTVAWTFLIHCDCPDDVPDRRLRKEDISAKFQRGEYFSENQKKLHKLL